LTVFPVFVRFGVSHLIFLRSDIVNCLISKLLVFFRFLGQKGEEEGKGKGIQVRYREFWFPISELAKIVPKSPKNKNRGSLSDVRLGGSPISKTKQKKGKKTQTQRGRKRTNSGPTPVARDGSGAKAPPLAARPNWRWKLNTHKG